MKTAKMRFCIYLLIVFTCLCLKAQGQATQEVNDALNIAATHKSDSSYLSHLHRAERLAIKAKDIYGLGDIYRIIGSYYSSVNHDSCVTYYHKAYKVFMDNYYKKAGIGCLYYIAQAYERQEALSTALDYASNSVFLYEQAKDSLSAADMYRYAALLQAKLGLSGMAKRDMNNAMSLYKSLNKRTELADCRRALGEIYKQAGQTDSAQIFFEKAKEE